MDSRQHFTACSSQFDILHTPAVFYLTTGQNMVMDSPDSFSELHCPILLRRRSVRFPFFAAMAS